MAGSDEGDTQGNSSLRQFSLASWETFYPSEVMFVKMAELPKATLGNRTLALTAWLHFALGNTLSQVIEVFNFHLQLKLSEGGLVQMWHRLAEVLYPWYEEIGRQARPCAVLFADETGWRVNGKTHWLWCFAGQFSTYFMIDRSRGSPALLKFFIEEFAGTLVSDFWGAYNAVVCAWRQTLRKRGHQPIHTVAKALAQYIQTGQLPPLPSPTGDGK